MRQANSRHPCLTASCKALVLTQDHRAYVSVTDNELQRQLIRREKCCSVTRDAIQKLILDAARCEFWQIPFYIGSPLF
jgi:hypothetical protein